MEENIEEVKKRDRLMIFTFASLALSLVSSITYMLYTIINRGSLVNHVVSIISVIVLVVISILLVVTGFFIENKKAKIFISIAALILAFYSMFQFVAGITSSKDLVLDFTDYDIKEVIEWADERDITVVQNYEYSEKYAEFHIISQDIKEGTPVKGIKTLTVTVSNGIDPNKTAEVTNMVGWDLDEVIKFIDDNKLTNVTINFEFSNTVEKDKIISQNVIREIRRNEPVTLVSSLGKESSFPTIILDNIVGLDTFHALVYLGRNNLKYSIIYTYSEDQEGIILNQSLKKGTVIARDENKEIVITIAKANEITVPDLTKMSKDEITEWATNNRIKIDYTEEYDDTIKEGKVISASYSKGSNIQIGTLINVVISKGQIKMIEFTDIDSFRKWADEMEINYIVEYEYSDTVDQGKLISSSHSKGETVKNTEIIKLVISDGGKTKIPDLINLTKSEAEAKCNEAKLTCKFTYLDNNTDYTIVTKQSMLSGSTVPTKTTITLTLGK